MIDGAPLAVLTEESEHQLGVLRRALKRAADFALHLVVAKDLGRAEAVRRLRAWSGVSGVPELHFFPGGEQGAREVEVFLAARDEEHGLSGAVIPDTEALMDVAEGGSLAALNVARDVLGALIRGPLVLVVSPEREGELARRAPDLFDVRAGTVMVEARAAEPREMERLVEATLLVAATPGGDSPPRPSGELQAQAAMLRTLTAGGDMPAGALADAWLKLGHQFLRQREIGEAREMARTAQKMAERVGYTSGVADGLALEAEALEGIGDAGGAIARYEKALVLQEKLGNRPALAGILLKLGAIAQRRGQLDQAQSCLEQSIALLAELGNRPGLALSYVRLGQLALMRGEVDKARDLSREALALGDALGDDSILALCYSGLALLAFGRGDLDEARALFEKARALQEEVGDRAAVAAIHHQLGSVERARGEPDKAKAQLEKALAIHEEVGERRELASSYRELVSTYRELGDVALDQGKLDKAQAWYERALVLAEELGSRPDVASVVHQLAAVAQARGELDKAQTWYEKAIALDEELGDRPGMARAHRGLGTLAEERGELDEAQSWHKRALVVFKELGLHWDMALSCSELGDLALTRGELDEAQSWHQEALTVFEKLANSRGVAAHRARLGTLAAVRGNFGEALDHVVRAAALLPQFPEPKTKLVTKLLVFLTGTLGMPALEAAWQRVMGQPLPAHVRSRVEDHLPPAPPEP